MKEIKAYVRNNMVNKVIDALAQLPEPPSVAAVPLETYGHGVTDDAYGRLRMTKLEVDIADARVEEVVIVIERAARTGEGHPGDGRILVTGVEAALRIDTGERDEDALK